MLLRAFQRYCNDDNRKIKVERTMSALRAGSNLGDPRLLRLCTEPEYDVNGHDVAPIGSPIPIGRPILPEPDSPARSALLHAWLRWCDESHPCNKHQRESKIVLPTRILYVGDPKDLSYKSDCLRLICASEASQQEYIALSHCWGNLSDEKKKAYCTTQDNIYQRNRGFSMSELPKTFQDAVKVTRELGVLYLWIDSLCIIQYGDDGTDWRSESGQMESVFSRAYCTISATAAAHSDAGFLKRNISPESIYVQDASGKQFYISTDIDDFDTDVGKALLNTRAWVMQEKVLAQRTILFSANQIYWECGEGIYCENLTRLKSPFKDQYFTLDPDFPTRLLESGMQRTINCISFLLQDYSKRNLTFLTDRCIAISGLESRIAGALGCQSRYGIFQKYLHRNLLWQASDNKMERIAYDNNQQIPSWSWMAYSGGIQFTEIVTGDVSWADNLEFDPERKSALIAGVGKIRNCTIKPDGDHYAVLNLLGRKRGWIRYDVEDGKERHEEQCVVVGRTEKSWLLGMREKWNYVEEYYILVVMPTSVDGEYRRVGAGMIRSSYVERHMSKARVV